MGSEMGKKPSQQDVYIKREEDLTLVRRSPVLTIGAKLLWCELLSYDWVTKGRSKGFCFPYQDKLAHDLAVSPRSVRRWLSELVEHKLLAVKRQPWPKSGNIYYMAPNVPEKVCPKELSVNTRAAASSEEIAEALRESEPVFEEDVEGDVEVAIGHICPGAPDSGAGGPGHICPLPPDISVPSPRTETPGGPDKSVLSNRSQLIEVYKKGSVQKGNVQIEHLRTKKCSRVSEGKKVVNKTLPSVGKNEVTTTQSSVVSPEIVGSIEDKGVTLAERTQPHEFEELISEAHPNPEESTDGGSLSQREVAMHRQRASRLAGMPSGMVTRQPKSAPKGAKYHQPPPKPPSSPEGVLALLRAEIEKKWGESAAKTVPFGMTGRDRKNIRDLILSKYDPDVVLAMIRLLVWDWKVVRKCFPPRLEHNYPGAEHLVLYRATLSGNTTSGFDRSDEDRGERYTYESIYLRGLEYDAEEANRNPFP